MNLFKRFTASVLIASTTMMGLPMVAQAGIVGSTESMTSTAQSTRAPRLKLCWPVKTCALAWPSAA